MIRLLVLCFVLASLHVVISEYSIESSYSSVDFDALTEQQYYVDKTAMLGLFFNNFTRNDYHYFVYPHGSGKRTNFHMFKRFVQLEVDEEGRIKDKKDTSAYKLFTNTSKNFQLHQFENTVEKHLAEYPIIWISFKGIMGSTYEETLSNFAKSVKHCYQMYDWLYAILSAQPSDDVRKKYHVEFFEKVRGDNLNRTEIELSLEILAEILHDYFDRKVFLFVEEYEAPITQAMLENHVGFDYRHILWVTSPMLSNLFKLSKVKNNVKYAYMTGTLPCIMGSIGVNYFKRYGYLEDNIFTPFHYFNETEVDELSYKHGLSLKGRYKLQNYYHGYATFRKAWTFYGVDVKKEDDTPTIFYNVYSVSNYFKHGTNLRKYWTDAEGTKSLIRFFTNSQFYRSFLELAVHRRISTQIRIVFFPEIYKHLIQRDPPDWDVTYLHTLLFELGYLSFTNEVDLYAVPNEEVVAAYTRTIYEYENTLGTKGIQQTRDTLIKIVKSDNVTQSLLDELRLAVTKFTTTNVDLCRKNCFLGQLYAACHEQFDFVKTHFPVYPKTPLAGRVSSKDLADLVIIHKNTTLFVEICLRGTLTKLTDHAKNFQIKESGVRITSKTKYLGINFRRFNADCRYADDTKTIQSLTPPSKKSTTP